MNYRAENHRLADICEIQIGYTVRGRLSPSPMGVPAVQLRDLRGEATTDLSSLPLYALGPSFERYWAEPGDILFRSRGEKNTASLIDPSTKGAAIAILPLMVLRPHRDRVDPAFLTWSINQRPAQTYFDKYAQAGTTMRLIPKQCLDDLELTIPDLATQRLIIETATLAHREHELSRSLADTKLKLAEFALLQQMRNAQPHGNGTGRIGARRNPAGKTERTD